MRLPRSKRALSSEVVVAERHRYNGTVHARQVCTFPSLSSSLHLAIHLPIHDRQQHVTSHDEIPCSRPKLRVLLQAKPRGRSCTTGAMCNCWPFRLFRRKKSQRPDEESSTALSDLPPALQPTAAIREETNTSAPVVVQPSYTPRLTDLHGTPLIQLVEQRPITPPSQTSAPPYTGNSSTSNVHPPPAPSSRTQSQPRFAPRIRQIPAPATHQQTQVTIVEQWHFNTVRSVQPPRYNPPGPVSSLSSLPSQRHRRSQQTLSLQPRVSTRPAVSPDHHPQTQPRPVSSQPNPDSRESALSQPAPANDSPTRWSDSAMQSRYQEALSASSSPRNRGQIRPLRSSSSLRSVSSTRVELSPSQRPSMPGRSSPYPPRSSSLPRRTVGLSSDSLPTETIIPRAPTPYSPPSASETTGLEADNWRGGLTPATNTAATATARPAAARLSGLGRENWRGGLSPYTIMPITATLNCVTAGPLVSIEAGRGRISTRPFDPNELPRIIDMRTRASGTNPQTDTIPGVIDGVELYGGAVPATVVDVTSSTGQASTISPPVNSDTTQQAPRNATSPPRVPLRSALRRRAGDVPDVLPTRTDAGRDDDSDEMGYEGDAERNNRNSRNTR